MMSQSKAPRTAFQSGPQASGDTDSRHPTAVASRTVTPPAPTFTLAAQAGLLAGPFLSMVDSNIVNVAIPDIAHELQTQLATAQWVVSGYLLALAAMLAASAFLANVLGPDACIWQACWALRSAPGFARWLQASRS